MVRIASGMGDFCTVGRANLCGEQAGEYLGGKLADDWESGSWAG